MQESLPIEDCYNNGVSCYESKNYTDAAEWLMKAANKGYAGSQCFLGYLYENGLGVRTSDEEAVKWFKKAAEQGLADAQHNLGYMYYNGCGTERDINEAVNWLKKAAVQGHSGAKSTLKMILGSLYNSTNG